MAKRDINRHAFDKGTQLKLNIFRECFREWFPVFAHNKYIKKIYIFDMFAGSGKDADGEYGSPLILLSEALGQDKQFCKQILEKSIEIEFVFNELLAEKKQILEKNVKSFFDECKQSCEYAGCAYDQKCTFSSTTFKALFTDPHYIKILQDKNIGKFVLLDQYGYKEIDDNIFSRLITFPKTDFIFFIASAYIKRFKTLPAVTDYFKNMSINTFDETKAKECHRIIANYYRQLIPHDKEYYLHHFSYKKGTNHYGLIFGTNHTYGMEKFLKVCWSHDKTAGESTENINNDHEEGSLFYGTEEPAKKREVKNALRKAILSKQITDNKTGLLYALKKGCLPSLYTEVVNELIQEKKINFVGKLNRLSSGIHNIKTDKIYKIQVLQQ